MLQRVVPLLSLTVAAVVVGACGTAGSDAVTSPAPATSTEEVAIPTPSPDRPVSSPATPATATPSAQPSPPVAEAPGRPGWLGTRVLPLREDGFGEVQDTPRELRDRRLPPPPGGLADPVDDTFEAQVQPVPDDVLARSTWEDACPVARDDLRYLTLTFRGFDHQPHTGELLVHADAAAELVAVFERLYAARFPLEEMRVVRPEELDAPPTGDGNNTTAFVCRPVRGRTSWSQHAYGLAIDLNPFHNPYTRDDLVLPELASAYADRSPERPGMILPGGPVVEAFTDAGWEWGGRWESPRDPMHFSREGG